MSFAAVLIAEWRAVCFCQELLAAVRMNQDCALSGGSCFGMCRQRDVSNAPQSRQKHSKALAVPVAQVKCQPLCWAYFPFS